MSCDRTDAAMNEGQGHLRFPVPIDAVPGSTPGKGGAERPRIRAPGACYFFLAGALAAVAFGALAGDTPSAGEITFLGCLGFLASRLPRIVLFANMFLLICRSRKRPPYRAVWAHLAILSRFFFWMPVARLPEEANEIGTRPLMTRVWSMAGDRDLIDAIDPPGDFTPTDAHVLLTTIRTGFARRAENFFC
ncbi:MAG TPA: hypothetical protein VG105_18805, partial [Paraburkholderia sp.]|nr:hypothetical protein [Paraburkholderia sp.]